MICFLCVFFWDNWYLICLNIYPGIWCSEIRSCLTITTIHIIKKSPKTCEFFLIKLCCNRSHVTYFVIFGSIFFGISEKQKVKGPFKRQWHQSSGKIPVWRCKYFAFKLQYHTSENFTFPDKKFKSMIISVNYYFVTFLSVLICIHIHPGKSSGKSQRVFKQTLGV